MQKLHAAAFIMHWPHSPTGVIVRPQAHARSSRVCPGGTSVSPTIHHNISRHPADLVAQFRRIWSSTLADTMGRHGVLGPEVRPIYQDIGLVGSAFTVQNYPNDNITTHRALQMV